MRALATALTLLFCTSSLVLACFTRWGPGFLKLTSEHIQESVLYLKGHNAEESSKTTSGSRLLMALGQIHRPLSAAFWAVPTRQRTQQRKPFSDQIPGLRQARADVSMSAISGSTIRESLLRRQVELSSSTRALETSLLPEHRPETSDPVVDLVAPTSKPKSDFREESNTPDHVKQLAFQKTESKHVEPKDHGYYAHEVPDEGLKVYLNSLYETPDLLTRDEEKVLSREVQTLLSWEAKYDELLLEDETLPVSSALYRVLGGFAPSEQDRRGTMAWAKACGFDDVRKFKKALRQKRAAKHRFIMSNLRLVVFVAKRYRQGSGSLSFLDLIQEGNIGLMDAIERYDPDKGCKFSTYAFHWIRRRVGRAIEDTSRVIRQPVHVYSDIRKLKKAQAEVLSSTGEDPSAEAVMERLEISKEKHDFLVGISGRVVKFESELPDYKQFQSVSVKSRPHDHYNLRNDMEALLSTVTPREADMLRHRYGFDGDGAKTLQEIGNLYNVSRERVRQICNQALEKLRVNRDYHDLHSYLYDLPKLDSV